VGIFARKIVPPIEVDPQVDPARPWAVLGLVNDWVRHAEAKAGATLVATGVTGTALYNLIHNVKHPPFFLAFFSTTAAVFVLLGGACGAAALRPRLWSREKPTSLLYFDHIARAFDSPVPYAAALRKLVLADDDELDQVAQQVWANARVARRKYRWVGWALVCLLLALISLGAVAAYEALRSIGVIHG
jgi:hypothetical protein